MEKLTHADFFTGAMGFTLAVEKAGLGETVLFSEIKKPCIKLMKEKRPHVPNIGDITATSPRKIRDFDLMTFGSSCTDLSVLKQNKEKIFGSSSRVFFNAVEVLLVKKPKHFMCENVFSMDDRSREMMSNFLGVEPVECDAVYFSGQLRQRLYFCSWIPQGGKMSDFNLEPKTFQPFKLNQIECPEKYILSKGDVNEINRTLRGGHEKLQNIKGLKLLRWSRSTRYPEDAPSFIESRYQIDGHANTLVTGKGCGTISTKNIVVEDGIARFLTPDECELLQCFPLGWTRSCSITARYSMMGNAINVDNAVCLLNMIK